MKRETNICQRVHNPIKMLLDVLATDEIQVDALARDRLVLFAQVKGQFNGKISLRAVSIESAKSFVNLRHEVGQWEQGCVQRRPLPDEIPEYCHHGSGSGCFALNRLLLSVTQMSPARKIFDHNVHG